MHGRCNARPTVAFTAAERHSVLTGDKLCCLMTAARVWTTCLESLRSRASTENRTSEWPLDLSDSQPAAPQQLPSEKYAIMQSIISSVLTLGDLSRPSRWPWQLQSKSSLNPVYKIQPVVKPVVQPGWQPAVSCLTNTVWQTRFDNRVERTDCWQPVWQRGLTSGCIVYTNIYPVVKPVWQPYWLQVVSCKRGFNITVLVTNIYLPSLFHKISNAIFTARRTCNAYA